MVKFCAVLVGVVDTPCSLLASPRVPAVPALLQSSSVGETSFRTVLQSSSMGSSLQSFSTVPGSTLMNSSGDRAQDFLLHALLSELVGTPPHKPSHEFPSSPATCLQDSEINPRKH
ncbi:hypothetical protein AMECASPLE_036810 [Ameca splendens]|uniref:Uncharacterized protein n=1 Tax=Ameca splendens TaxID=208324 RepID=A0ABV0ZSZ9_9TELE